MHVRSRCGRSPVVCYQPLRTRVDGGAGQPARLTPFIAHARPAGRGLARRAARTAASRQRSGDIRARAEDQGIAVSDRGRIPASVVKQYQAAAKGR
jgi:hypothetical protein